MRPARLPIGVVAGVVMAVAGAACGPLGGGDVAVTSSARTATASGDAGGASTMPSTAPPTAFPTSHENTPATPRLTASPMTPDATPTTPRPTGPATPVAPLQGLALEQVASGLVQPLGVVARPGDGALFAVQQQGTVVRITDDGTPADQPLLDVSDHMEIHSIEQGLLGMAFHPRYPEDPRVFVFHSLPSNDNVLVSYEVSDDREHVDADSRTMLLTIDKEPDKVRHNGGTVLFGPDGMLWLSLGDAARASVNGQDPSTLPGSILRLDVDEGDPYAIPPDNPFADGATVDGVTGAPEVYWFGLRNPWRFSIDEPTGTAWIGNVGQETVEEVEVAPIDEGGINFGWPAFEGTEPFYDDPPVTESVDPVFEVRHDDTGEACSLTGGEVYRGATTPELEGHYFYADWCVGWIRSFALDDGEVVEQQDWSEQLDVGMVSSFGTDADGELLVVDWDAGVIFRIVAER